jgi:hypothetical protein
MSSEQVLIDLRNLEGGEQCTLKGVLPPASLALDPSETKQFSVIEYKLEVQIVGESLLVRADIRGEQKNPCRICNKLVVSLIEVIQVNEVMPLDDIKGYKVDLTTLIRNLFLMEAFDVVECNSGSCIERSEVENFLKRKRLSSSPFDSLT